MTRGLYTLLLWLLWPAFALAGWRRCRKAQRLGITLSGCFKSRWGWTPSGWRNGGIWLHAVSVGESRSIFPLLEALQARHPDLPITITNGSIQGALQVQKYCPVPVQNGLIPYDYPFAMRRFLKRLRPKLVVIVETELWPNLYHLCHQHGIPLLLINARLKEKSFHAYQRWGQPLVRQTLQYPTLIGVQFPIDAERFKALGAPPARVRALGNLKSDLRIPDTLHQQAQQLRQQVGQRFIWCAGSTHAGEEALVWQAHQQLLKKYPDALLILAPRHADRFDEVATWLEKQGIPYVRRSQNTLPHPTDQVWLIDTLGELLLFYALSDTSFVGGTLVPFGGHNILEPAALNKPVLSGPHYGNLQALYETMLHCGGVEIIPSPEALGERLIQLVEDVHMRQYVGDRARYCFDQLQGALPRTLAAIEHHL